MLTVVIALAANTTLAVLKSLVAAVTGSASMVAEAAHSWADAGNEVFLVVAERRSAREADRAHPLGHGREAYVWSMIAAFGLFAVGAAVSVIHGIQSLDAEEQEADYLWAYLVLGVALVLEGISFLQARREVRRGARDADLSRATFLDRTSNPTLRAVFFEDAAALTGILIAAAGLALHQATGQPVWDAIGSILVGLLLGWIAIYLLRRNMAFLVGQVADPRAYAAVLEWLRARPEVQSVSTLHLEYVGPDRLFLVGSVDLAGDDRESEAAEELQRLEDQLEQRPEVARAVLSLAAPGRPPSLLGNNEGG
ncbi:cation diffusion facilitator family transporter [Nocardioides sp. S-58]|uniref:Cation diffusion facilitator family transporter n=1 Tax=Nocardioides renjunii TaxID=3095075 RepID=A0ABU5KCF7_9ACTN|nr:MULTISPECIES: cation diffusion facilitator family transporter [unclassified Nocardioides]MDZ5662626.1 cation diffusion facilitator family transporter [Nocardioides sp. S-58]WQQ23584.1 cation diffusion facilitator family transporter [Nocardioides sp. S-34]